MNKILIDETVVKLALEALLKTQNEGFNLPGSAIREAITAIKESLAQPDQDEVDIRSRLYQRIHELETQLAQPEHKKCENCGEFGECCQDAQPKQEPVAYLCKRDDGNFDVLTDQTCKRCFPVYTTPPQPVVNQSLTTEPVAWANRELTCFAQEETAVCIKPLSWLNSTTPPQRKPLTDEQILHFVDTHVGAPSMAYPLDNSDWMNFARAIEAAHGIKE